MGVGIGGRSCASSPYAAPNSNPDPAKFSIVKERTIGRFLLLKVRYPNCSNFEGLKILVFENITSANALMALTKGRLDPHFTPHGVQVFARFPPTTEGWKVAKTLARTLTN